MNLTPIVVNGSDSLFAGGVFLAGILSFFSPCTFPLLPVYIGILTDQNVDKILRVGPFKFSPEPIIKTFLFILGLSTTFVTLGFGFGALGSVINGEWFAIISGLVVILLGLHQMEIFRLPGLGKYRVMRLQRSQKSDLLGAYLLGLTFSFGWTPCVGPVLGAVLAVSASSGQGLLGGGLMAVYTLGLAIPFVVMALLSGAALVYFEKLETHLSLLKKVGGALIVIMGLFLLTGQLNQVAIFFDKLL